MSSTGFNKLPVELAFHISEYLDHVSIARLSCVCKNLSQILKDASQKAARQYALLPALRAPRCAETEVWDMTICTRPQPSTSHVQMAIIEGRTGCLRAFLDAGVNPNSFGPDGHRLLSTALRNRRLDAVNMLIEYKVNLKLYLRLDLSVQDGYIGCQKYSSPMVYAILHGRYRGIGRSFLPDTGGPNRPVDVVSPLIRAGYKWFSGFDLDAMRNLRDFPQLMRLAFDHGLNLKSLHRTGNSKDTFRWAFRNLLSWPIHVHKLSIDGIDSTTYLHHAPVVRVRDTQPLPVPEYLDLLALAYAKYPEFLKEQLFLHDVRLTALQEAIYIRNWLQVVALLANGVEVGVRHGSWMNEMEFLERTNFMSEDVKDLFPPRFFEELRVGLVLEMRLQLIWYDV